MADNLPGGRVPLALMMFVVAAVTWAYWIVWFLVPDGKSWLATLPDDSGYIRFENAFLVADTWMAVAALFAGIALLRTHASAVPWLFMAGSAGLYLGGMDILFDVQNGIYAMIAGAHWDAVVTEIAINLGTIGFSLWAISWAAKHRRWAA